MDRPYMQPNWGGSKAEMIQACFWLLTKDMIISETLVLPKKKEDDDDDD